MEAANLGNAPDFSDPSKEKVLFALLEEKLSDEDFLRAITRISQTCEFWPTVKKIFEYALPEGVLPASQAWDMIEQEMERCCGAPGEFPKEFSPITERVIASMTCSMGIMGIWKDPRDRAVIRKDFMTRYNETVSAERSQLQSQEVKQVDKK